VLKGSLLKTSSSVVHSDLFEEFILKVSI